MTLAVEAFNLLDRADSDIAYFYASRLPGEPAEGVEDVHVHPDGAAILARFHGMEVLADRA